MFNADEGFGPSKGAHCATSDPSAAAGAPVLGIVLGGTTTTTTTTSIGGGSAVNHCGSAELPPPHPSARPVHTNCVGGRVEGIACANIEIADAVLVNAHCTGAYIRNCSVTGGAFGECTFKSCKITDAAHVLDCKFDDCVIQAGTTVTRGRLRRTCNEGGVLLDCKDR